jgi:hypothetical protein
MLAHPEPTANLATKDHVDHPARLAHLAPRETKAPLETPARLLEANQARLARPDPLANQAPPVPQASPAMLARTATPVPPVPLEMPVPPVVPARLAVPVAPEMLARTARLAAATTAHRLGWLQVIKQYHRRWSMWLADIFHHRPPSSHHLLLLPSPINQFGVTAIFYFLSSQTFHVEKINSFFFLTVERLRR